MQKIYLLLRNNIQSGPLTLEELLCMNLKNTDLIWIEGRSLGWAFPGEIESIRSFLPGEEKIFVPVKTIPSAPGNPETTFSAGVSQDLFSDSKEPGLESKAEELHNRALNQNSQTRGLKKNYVKSLDEVENDYALWVIRKQKKKKRFSGKKIGIAGILLIGSVAGWMMADMTFSGAKPIAARAAQPVINISPSREVLSIEDPLILTPQNETNKQAVLNKIKTTNPGASSKTTKETNPIQASPVEPSSPEVLVASVQENIPVEEASHSTEAEKKTSLKEKIGTWLKGGKELSQPAREKEAKSIVDISGEVELKILKDPTYWMMGVKGHKLIVSNKSENILHAAVVELLYYSEENDLLEKRKMEVSGLGSGKSKTLAIPDHKMADHVEARIGKAHGE